MRVACCTARSTGSRAPDGVACSITARGWYKTRPSVIVTGGLWQATSDHDPGAVLTADTPAELREKIRADYARRNKAVSIAADAQERMST